jgi:hypothetical protein
LEERNVDAADEPQSKSEFAEKGRGNGILKSLKNIVAKGNYSNSCYELTSVHHLGAL